MADEPTPTSGSMNRRSYLRAAVAGGAVPFLPESVTADDLTDYGTVNFVEAGVVYDVEDGGIDGILPTAHVDEWLLHAVGPEGDVLFLNESFLEDPGSTFEGDGRSPTSGSSTRRRSIEPGHLSEP